MLVTPITATPLTRTAIRETLRTALKLGSNRTTRAMTRPQNASQGHRSRIVTMLLLFGWFGMQVDLLGRDVRGHDGRDHRDRDADEPQHASDPPAREQDDGGREERQAHAAELCRRAHRHPGRSGRKAVVQVVLDRDAGGVAVESAETAVRPPRSAAAAIPSKPAPTNAPEVATPEVDDPSKPHPCTHPQP
jgi:hypothetical protein